MQKKIIITGFTILEIIIAMAIISVLSIPVLRILIQQPRLQAITFNDMHVVINNTHNIYRALLELDHNTQGNPIQQWVNPNNANVIDCFDPEVNITNNIYSLVCKNNLGNNTKYSINSNTFSSNIINPFDGSNNNSTTISYHIRFYTRLSANDNWKEFADIEQIIQREKK